MNTKPLILTAKAIGKKYNLDITIGGTAAYTNGKRINIPAVTGAHANRLARGYLDHEAGHVRLTDFNFQVEQNFRGQLLNIIEDVWTEKVMGDEYPGCLINLRDLTALLEEEMGCFTPDPKNPETSILTWIMGRARIDVLGHTSMEKSTAAAEGLVRTALGTRFITLQQLVATIGNIVTTSGAARLRDKIMDLLKDALQDFDKQQQQQQQQAGSGQQGQGQSGNEAGKPGDSSSGNSGQPNSKEEKKKGESKGGNSQDGDQKQDGKDQNQGQSGQGNAQDGQEQKGDGQGQGGNKQEKDQKDNSGSDAADSKTSSTQSPADSQNNGQGARGKSQSDANAKQGNGAGTGGVPPQKAKDALLNATNDTKKVKTYGLGEVLKPILDKNATTAAYSNAGAPALPKAHPIKGDSRNFPDLDDVKRHTAKLRAKLSGLVQAQRLKRSTPKSNGIRLDRRVLTRLSSGDTRVFQRREEKKDVNTAVVLMLDFSGSMGNQSNNRKIQVATRSCYIVHEALAAIPRVKVASGAFNGHTDALYLMCGFGDKPSSGKFNLNGSGGTMLGHALYWSYAELMNRPEPRKICIAFSDGDTGDPNETRSAIKAMEAAGIQVLGIGIQDHSMKIYLPEKSEIINDLETLTPALLGLFEKLLTENKT